MRQLLCRKDEAIGIIADIITAAIGGLRFVSEWHSTAVIIIVIMVATPIIA